MLWRVALATLGLALVAPAAAAASNGFVERVNVLHEWHGEPSGYLGWAVSELDDIDHDHATDLIFSEPSTPDGGRTWVYSGRSGKLIYRLPGEPGDDQGYAIADAGDTNRDGIHDIISGAPSQTGMGPGRAYLYSGRSGRLLHTFTGDAAGDQLGSAVSSAGDQNHDGYDDVLVGAQRANAAYVFSGRTYKLFRRYDGAPGAGLGSGADTAARHRLIIGALTEGGTGGAHVFSGTREVFSLAPPPGASRFGQFFVAGVGRDYYVGDYNAQNGNGFAGVYSGRDGSLIHGWPGGPGDGTGPGREAGHVNHDGRIDLAVGSYTASDGAPAAGRVDVRSGRTGNVLRTITSTTEGENLGFDAVGVGDVNRDGRIDLLISAAEGDTVYLVAG
jgi:FG-GAP repeat